MTAEPSGVPLPPDDTAAVILAAGGGRRFATSAGALNLAVSHKLLAPLRGRTVFECALSNAVEAGFVSIIVVAGAVRLPLDRLQPDRVGASVEVLQNGRWAEGQATSLAMALDTLKGRPGIRHAVVGLGDQPFIPPQSWRAVALADPAAAIVVATYDGERRNPVRLSRPVWDLVPTEGDEGARPLLRSHAHLVTEVACQGDPADIDTAEDLLRWS